MVDYEAVLITERYVDMSSWLSKTCDLRLLLLCIVTTLQLISVETLNSWKPDHTCSSRADGLCIRCNGVPECFDLSDEAGCPNTSLAFIPVQEAAKSCSGRGCLKGFPAPPPLPPFSLCNRTPVTSPSPITTTLTTPVTTSTPLTTSQSTSVPITTKVTTKSTQCPTKGTTQYVTRETTQHPKRRTTTIRPWSTRHWPYVTTTTTSTPLSTTTLHIPTTTEYDFMKCWRRCSSWYSSHHDILSCVLRLIQRRRSNNCIGCFDSASQATVMPPILTPPTTAIYPIFNPIPTQIFPTAPPTTHPPMTFTDLNPGQGHVYSNGMTEQDILQLYMMLSHVNK